MKIKKEFTKTFYKKEGPFKPKNFLKNINYLALSLYSKSLKSKLTLKFNNETFLLPEKKYEEKLKNNFLSSINNQKTATIKIIIEGEDEEEVTNILNQLEKF